MSSDRSMLGMQPEEKAITATQTLNLRRYLLQTPDISAILEIICVTFLIYKLLSLVAGEWIEVFYSRGVLYRLKLGNSDVKSCALCSHSLLSGANAFGDQTIITSSVCI